MGVAILNKAGGIYGVLSLFTGHPINFWQWLYNFLNILVLPFYISGMLNLKNRANNARKLSLTCLVYIIDTVVGVLYTIYFIYFWFSREDNNPTAVPGYSSGTKVESAIDTAIKGAAVEKRDKAASALSSQSASPGRELFLTVSTILVVTTIRFYSTLVVLAFTKALLKQDANAQRYDNTTDTEVEELLKSNKTLKTKIKLYIYDLEIKSKEILRDYFL